MSNEIAVKPNITNAELNIQRQNEKLMTLCVPREVVKFMDEKILKILVSEYFFANRGIDSLSKMFGIPVMDLRYFFNSAEAKTILDELKSTSSEEIKKDRSLAQIKTFIIEKLEALLNNSSNRDTIEAVERIVPQLINLERIMIERDNPINLRQKSLYDIPTEITDADFNMELDTKEISVINNEDFINQQIVDAEDQNNSI